MRPENSAADTLFTLITPTGAISNLFTSTVSDMFQSSPLSNHTFHDQAGPGLSL